MNKYVFVENNVAKIKVIGEYSLLNAPVVLKELDGALQNGCTKVCVDFVDTTYIDSAALKGLMGAYRKVKKNLYYINANADGVKLPLINGNFDKIWGQEK